MPHLKSTQLTLVQPLLQLRRSLATLEKPWPAAPASCAAVRAKSPSPICCWSSARWPGNRSFRWSASLPSSAWPPAALLQASLSSAPVQKYRDFPGRGGRRALRPNERPLALRLLLQVVWPGAPSRQHRPAFAPASGRCFSRQFQSEVPNQGGAQNPVDLRSTLRLLAAVVTFQFPPQRSSGRSGHSQGRQKRGFGSARFGLLRPARFSAVTPQGSLFPVPSAPWAHLA